ncbi:MAG: GvpL/GvpF family gas vesicle protein [Actinobacteria bacterium]|nr:GvpL/GvpF family gas vesicle protein [Actinomycetota bacterium]
MSAEQQDRRRQEQEGNVWVYGVVPAHAAMRELERRGDRLPEVWVVEAGDLGAIAGPAPAQDEQGTRDQALAHARVLEAAVVDAPVVPFRFGIMVPETEDVGDELLLPQHDELAQLLARVEGRIQMTLKAYYDEDTLLREIVEREPEIARLREELRDMPEDESHAAQVRLGELVSAAVDQARERDAAELLEQLQPVAVSAATDPLEREYMVLNAPPSGSKSWRRRASGASCRPRRPRDVRAS